MQKSLPINRGLAFLLIATLLASAIYHTDLIGHVAYAVERGKLQADVEHLAKIDEADVATLEKISQAFELIAEVVRSSVVNVEARSALGAPHDELGRILREHGLPLPPNFPLPPRKGIGSGVILDTQGHIVTNNHVIDGAEVIEVTLADGREYRAEVRGADAMTDIAVIKINAEHLHPARLGDSDRMKVGNIVLAIGSPFRLGHSVSHGIISALGRTSPDVDIDYQNWIQTDAAINPGNSGGPLINTWGEVIGINTAIATENGGHQGVGFAIPANVVARVAEQLRSGEVIERGYLGVVIKPVTPKVADAYGLDEPGGVFIDNVVRNTPAGKGGLKPEDIIKAIDGRQVQTREQLQEIIASTKPGTDVEISVWRDRAMQQLALRVEAQPEGFSTTPTGSTLGEWLRDSDETGEDLEDGDPNLDADASISFDEDSASDTEVNFQELGFAADTVSPKLRKEYGLSRAIQSGAVITRVSPTGEAFAVRLQRGVVIVRVNGKRINNVSDLEQILTADAIVEGVRLKVEQTVTREVDGELVRDTVASYYVLRVR
jgi:serine protease Do